MSRLEVQNDVWANVGTVLEGNGVSEQKAAQRVANAEQERQRWQSVIDHYLLMWAQDATELEDEGIIPPSKGVIRRSCQVAGELREAGLPGPDRVAATGDGGIVFVRQTGSVLSSLEIAADGSVEVTVFRDCHLESRQRLR
jgi:hypothetical protein